jgi:hypothetical protein
MSKASLRKLKTKSLATTATGYSLAHWPAMTVAVLAGSLLLLGAAVGAYNHSALKRINDKNALNALAPAQASVPQARKHTGRLSLQPQADKLRRRLGQRFLAPGRERATILGTLTFGSQQSQVRIVRTQNDLGETVEIALNGGPGSLTWNAGDGAKSGASQAGEIERELIERLALDSPDQFVLAQLRGASYYTVARNVVPEEALQAQRYSGSAWDVVRVDEPNRIGLTKPESSWRMFYINSETGLPERIISSEKGQPIMAELLEWSGWQGELAPGRIRWSRNGQVVMEFMFTAFAYGSR